MWWWHCKWQCNSRSTAASFLKSWRCYSSGQIDHPLARAAPTNTRPNYERLKTSYSPWNLMTNATAVYAWDHSLWQKDHEALRRSWRVGSCCHAHETIVWSQNETNKGEPTNAAGSKNMQETRNSSNLKMHLHTLHPTLGQSSWHQNMHSLSRRATHVCPPSTMMTE